MVQFFGWMGAGSRGISNERRGAGFPGRKFGSLLFAAFAVLSAATATPVDAGCQTGVSNISASPTTVTTGSATQITLSATVQTLGVQFPTPGNNSTCGRAIGTPVEVGQLTFTVTNGSGATIGSTVTDTQVGADGLFTGAYNFPANTPAGSFTVTAAYVCTGTGNNGNDCANGEKFNGNSTGTSTNGITASTPRSDMSVSLQSLPATLTFGVAVPSGSNVVCTNALPGTIAATTATCSASGLPAGLTLGACSATSNPLAIGGTITCPITGTPTSVPASAVTVTGTTSAVNDGFGDNNTTTKQITINKADQAPFSISAATPIPLGGTTTATPSGGTGSGTVTYEVDPASSGVCSVNGSGEVTTITVGSCIINATKSGGANYNDATASATITIEDQTAPVLSAVPGDITQEATAPTGAVVNFSGAIATDTVDGTIAVTYSPASGSVFALGDTTVTVSATDTAGNTASATFNVTVVDTTAPALTPPSNATIEATSAAGASVAFSASATDAVDTSPSIVFTANSAAITTPAIFPLGNTIVTVTATDDYGNMSTDTFTVTVQDTTAPVVTAPANMTVGATGPSGATVNYSGGSATDIVDGTLAVTYSPAPGSTFVIGTTTVTVSATDSAGNTGTATFTVTVTDQAAPEVVASNIVVPATGPSGASVTLSNATATDAVDGALTVTYSPPSGTFAIGETVVTASATDSAGNTGTATFTVTVTDQAAPVITVPSDITVEATSAAGAIVNFTVSASDAVDGDITPTAAPASGSTFPLGDTTVNVTASDLASNVAVPKSFTVTVQDTTAPQLTVPGDITAYAGTSGTATVNFTATASDLVDPEPTIAYSLAPGSSFALGTATITVTATDARGNISAAQTFNVTVLDNTTPAITCPANVSVSTEGAATGAVASWIVPVPTDNGGAPVLTVAYVPAGELGPGSSFPLGATQVTYTATDAAENSASCSFSVIVTDGGDPSLEVPADITENATSAAGAPVVFAATATDIGEVTITYAVGSESVTSGDTFPIGETTVTVTATDAAGNTTTGTFKITVSPIAAVLVVSPVAPVVLGSGPIQIELAEKPTSPAPVNYSSANTDVCTVDEEGLVTLVGPGTCTINATQAAFENFLAVEAEPVSFQVSPAPVVTITPGTLPNGTEDAAYPSTNFEAATGGNNECSYTFSVAREGTLPPGMTLTQNGLLSGTPASSGTFTFTVVATPSGVGCGEQTSKVYTIAIRSAAPAPAPTISLAPGSLPDGDQGLVYATQTITASGGTAPYQFALTGGALPAGLVLAGSGALSGTPGAHGTFTFTVTATDTNGFTGNKTFTLIVRTDFIERRTSEVNRNFMQHRADIITSQGPDRLKNRGRLRGNGGGSQMSGGNNVPISVGISGGETGDSPTRFSFATSLGQMLQASRARQAGSSDPGRMALGGGLSQTLPSGRDQGFDIWVEGNMTHFRGDDSKSKGDLTLVYLGADYLLQPGLLLGTLVQFDSMSERNTTFGSEVRGHGWMAGPYMSAEIMPNLVFDARALWGQSENQTSPFGTYVDKFDTTRWLVRADLTGTWDYGPWRLTPSGSISYYQDDQDAYVDSNGIAIASQKVSLGRLMFGPEVGYRFKASDGTTVEPFVGFQGIYDFDTDGTTVNGVETGGEGWRGKAQIGLGLIAPSGYSMRGTASYDGIGSDDFEAVSGQVWVDLPLN